MDHPTGRLTARQRAMFVTALVLTLTTLFRYQIGNGFTVLFGEEYDGNIEIAILEHWLHVLQGGERWDQVPWFYPYRNTLGYNDGYLLYGLVYSVFRAVGLDPYLACEWVNVVVRAVGYAGFVLFARSVAGVRLGWALLGATVFTLASSAFLHAVHAQLLSVSFAPLLGWLIVRALAALQAGRQRAAAAWGGMTALFYCAWLMTAFYMAWFCALFAGLTVAAYLLVSAAGHGARRAELQRLVSWPVVVAALVFVAGCVPFLRVYLAKAGETGMHPFEATLPYMPVPADLIHVGSGNLLFGWLDRWLTAAIRPGFPDMGEHTVGLPPVLLLLCALGLVFAWRQPVPTYAALTPGLRHQSALWRAIAIALPVATLLSLRIGDVLPWEWVFRAVPGAAAVRVVTRHLLFLACPATLLAVLFASWHLGRWPAPFCVALAALLVAEQLNAQPPLGLDRPASLRVLASVPPPPTSCRAFFTSTRPNGPLIGGEDLDGLYRHNVPAMLIAEWVRLPTINGFSTFNPPDWDFAFPAHPDYAERVRRYAAAHGVLQGLCGLDLAQMRWDTSPFGQR